MISRNLRGWCTLIQNARTLPTVRWHTISKKPFESLVKRGYNGIDKLKNYGIDNSNQKITTEKRSSLEQLIGEFFAPINVSFGYGSGVLEQEGYRKNQKSQIDLIHVVNDPIAFHQKNMENNWRHYSALRFFRSSKLLNFIQEWGAGMYFNPYVRIDVGEKMQSGLIKYGTISRERALKDLSEWSNLYLAGRLQKPVVHLRDEEDTFVSTNQYNLRSALSLALLLIESNRFDELVLYETITRISYMGDPRMLVGGENINKAKNIVNKQFAYFQKLYGPHVDDFIDRSVFKKTGILSRIRHFEKALDRDGVAAIIASFPLQFRRRLYNLYQHKYNKELFQDSVAQSVLNRSLLSSDTFGPFTYAIADDKGLHGNLVKTVQHTVRYPAFIQAIKGIFTAGIAKSINYAWEKNVKYRS